MFDKIKSLLHIAPANENLPIKNKEDSQPNKTLNVVLKTLALGTAGLTLAGGLGAAGMAVGIISIGATGGIPLLILAIAATIAGIGLLYLGCKSPPPVARKEIPTTTPKTQILYNANKPKTNNLSRTTTTPKTQILYNANKPKTNNLSRTTTTPTKPTTKPSTPLPPAPTTNRSIIKGSTPISNPIILTPAPINTTNLLSVKGPAPISNHIIPASPPPKPPIGIKRPFGSNNCCINSLIHGIVHIDSLRAALKDNCEIVISAYTCTQNDGEKVITGDLAKNVRNYLHTQQDRRNPPWLITHEIPALLSLPTNEENDDPDLAAALQRSLLDDPEANQDLAIQNSMLSFSMEAQEDPTEILDVLLEKSGNQALVGPRIRFSRQDLNQNSLVKLFTKALDEYNQNVPLAESPSEFFIYNDVFYRDDEGNNYKNAQPFDDVSVLKLPLTPQAEYTCDYYVLHHGETVQAGHYTCGIKLGDNWFRIDDHEVTTIRELTDPATPIDPITAEKEIRLASILHYSRTKA